MNKISKKSIAFVLSFMLSIFIFNPISTNAYTNQTEEGPQIINTYTNEGGTLVTTFDDGVIVEGDVGAEEFKVLVPAYQSEQEAELLMDTGSSIQPRGWIKVAKVVIGVVLTTCSVIETYVVEGFNPCKIVWDYLFPKKPSDGTYIISAQYIPGKVPGCVPINSGPCNSGYYEYTFSKQ